MSILKFFLSLLTLFGLLCSSTQAFEIQHWGDLPVCAQTCVGFAYADVVGASQCGASNITCNCESGGWRDSLIKCIAEPNPYIPGVANGCVPESDETKNAIVTYIKDIYCPTRNETKDPDPTVPAASWSQVTLSKTYTITTSKTMVMTIPASKGVPPVANASTVDASATALITSIPTMMPGSASFVQSNTTTTSGAPSVSTFSMILYQESTLAVVIFVAAMIAMVG